MSQLGKEFKQRYYRNIYTLSLFRPVLHSGNVKSEHFAAGKNIQTTILLEYLYYKPLYASVFSVNFLSEHVAAGESFQTMILSEHLNFEPLKASVTFSLLPILTCRCRENGSYNDIISTLTL